MTDFSRHQPSELDFTLFIWYFPAFSPKAFSLNSHHKCSSFLRINVSLHDVQVPRYPVNTLHVHMTNVFCMTVIPVYIKNELLRGFYVIMILTQLHNDTELIKHCTIHGIFLPMHKYRYKTPNKKWKLSPFNEM